MPDLVLGPLLRHVAETTATVWVQTDGPCDVEVLGATAPTFRVGERHFGIVVVEDLEPGRVREYDVVLDGERRWPPEDHDYPPSSVRTPRPDGPVTLVVGSCRVPAPHEPPYDQKPGSDSKAVGSDALHVLARTLAEGDRADWPDAMLLVGDQVYADGDPTGRHKVPVVEFDEFCRLYERAWSSPEIRWLLSVVPSAMVFDDHEIHDDWNISAKWVEEIRRNDWWPEHVSSGLMSYWLYQHLGNLTPTELADDEVLADARAADDAEHVLREFARSSDTGTHGTEGARWSFRRDLGPARLLVIDSRAGRLLEPGERAMLDDDEEAWVEEQAAEPPPHLLLASSVPFLGAPGIHEVERWNEAVEAGRWGRRPARLAEWLRESLDLDHWGAFGRSFEWLEGLLRAVASGERGRAPASITMLSGDVHFHYVARAGFAHGSNRHSPIHQVVSSPIRHALPMTERIELGVGASRPGAWLARGLRRLAGLSRSELRWNLDHGPWFENGLATLLMDDQRCRVLIDVVPWDQPEAFERVLELELTDSTGPEAARGRGAGPRAAPSARSSADAPGGSPQEPRSGG